MSEMRPIPSTFGRFVSSSKAISVRLCIKRMYVCFQGKPQKRSQWISGYQVMKIRVMTVMMLLAGKEGAGEGGERKEKSEGREGKRETLRKEKQKRKPINWTAGVLTTAPIATEAAETNTAGRQSHISLLPCFDVGCCSWLKAQGRVVIQLSAEKL